MKCSALFTIIATARVLSACGGRVDVQCEQNADCNLSGGGQCTPTASGSTWCAYPDPNCPSGYRFSDLDVGDGVSGQCVAEQPPDAGVDDALDSGSDANRSWSAPMLLANVNSAAEERMPAPSADGLELYFARLSLNPPYGEIYVARRTSTSQPFGAPDPVTEVNGSNSNEIFAVPSHSGLELFVSMAGIITAYTRATAASQWGNGTSTGITAQFISLSADDLTMYIVARCPQGVHNGTGPCFWYSTRTAPGSAWSAPANLAFDGTTQWNAAAASGDGLRLLVSDNFSGSGIPVAEQQRMSTSEPWSDTEVISALDLETTNKDARWNADGTEVYLTAKPASNSANLHDIYISVLQ